MKRFWFLLSVLVIFSAFISCNPYKNGLSFGDLKNVKFTEARRVFNTGLVFDKIGYQLEPSWKLYFTTDTSVRVFSPKMKRYYDFHIYFDHDSIFNMVDTWFWLKKLNKDSMVLRSLRVENKVVKQDDEGSNVYMTFYSDRYIDQHPSRSIQKMGLPGPRDTAYIKAKSILANTHNDSAFSGRQPVVLESKSELLKVEKVKSVSTAWNKIDPSIDYLYPEYNITIHHAYENFGYIFTAYADEKGQIRFKESMIPYSPEFKAQYEHVIKGIIDGYLKLYLKVIPGNTLGIPHTSTVYLNVSGKTN